MEVVLKTNLGKTEARDLLLHSLFESLREVCGTETPLPTWMAQPSKEGHYQA